MLVHRVSFFAWKPESALCVRFNAQKTLLAVSRADSSIEIWAQHPYFHCVKIIPAFSGTAQAARRLVWVGDNALVSAGWSGELCEWTLGSLELRSSSASFGGPVWDLAVNAAGTLLAVACEDGGLRLFDVSDGVVFRRSLSTGSCRVLCCAFSLSRPDHVILGDSKGRLQVWDYVTGKQILKVSVSGAKVHSPVWAVTALPDGCIATGDSIGYTQIWDGAFGTLLHSFKTHEAAVLTLRATPEGTLFSSGADSNVVRMERAAGGDWVVAGNSRPGLHDVHSLELAGNTLVAAGLDGSLALFGLRTFSKKKCKTLRPFPAFHSPVLSVSSPARIVCLRHSRSVELHRLGRAAGTPEAGLQSGTKLRLARAHAPLVEIRPDCNLPMHFAEISPSSELVLMGSREGVRGYSVEVAEDRATVARVELPDQLARIAAVRCCFSDDVVALATFGGDIHVFSLSDFGLVRTIGFHKKRFVCCLSGREQVLASADDQHHVAVHNAESGDCLFALPPFDLAVTALAFVPGENWLAVATLSDQIFVVDFVKKQHTPWSTMVGDKTDTSAEERGRTCVLGFAFGDKMMWWGNSYVNALDISQVKNSKVQRIDRYSDVIGMLNVSKSEVVVVERSWKSIVSDLPPPLARHRYIL